MQFKGGTVREQQASREAWEQWRRVVRSGTRKRLFVERFVELAEMHIANTSGQHAGHVADGVMLTVNQTVMQNRPLSPRQRREAILILVQCWRYSVSLRKWAIDRGYIKVSDH